MELNTSASIMESESAHHSSEHQWKNSIYNLSNHHKRQSAHHLNEYETRHLGEYCEKEEYFLPKQAP